MNILDPATPAEIMQHFDRLPPPLRMALAGAAFPFDPRLISHRQAAGQSARQILKTIADLEARARP